jgi:hypothetical protein
MSTKDRTSYIKTITHLLFKPFGHIQSLYQINLLPVLVCPVHLL